MSGGYTEITIIIDNKSDSILGVKVNDEVREGKALAPPALAELYKLDNVIIGYKKDESPCCIIINNMEYCWC